jgi:hypothetical protein
MPLTQAQEDQEHELRVDQMTINIEKMRAEMAAETRKFVVQAIVAAAAIAAASAAVATYLAHLSR